MTANELTLCITASNGVFEAVPGSSNIAIEMAEQLPSIFSYIESELGPSNCLLPFLGVYLSTTKSSRVKYGTDSNGIYGKIVCININKMHNRKDALLDLVHECVHILVPGVEDKRTFLEEALATEIAFHYVKFEINIGVYTYGDVHDEYKRAATALRNISRDVPTLIKSIRASFPEISISDVTDAMLLEEIERYRKTSEDDKRNAAFLTSKLDYDTLQ